MGVLGARIGAWLGVAAPGRTPSAGDVVLDDETLGAVAVDLAWRWPTWVNRRVETIEFVEDTTVRRSMSVDFTFPDPDKLAAPVEPNARIVVPLQILAKETLMHVDVFDEQGTSLSTLNTEHNGDLSGRGLVRLLDAIHRDERDEPLPEELAADLKFIVRAKREDAWHRRNAILAPGSTLAELLNLYPPEPVDDDEPVEPPRPEALLIDDLALGFLQLVQVEYQPGAHRVLKVAYDVPQAWEDPMATRGWERALGAIGALPRRQTFSNINTGQGMGYHIEVVAPEDTEIVEAKLTGYQWSTETNTEEPLDREAQVQSRSRAHVHVGLRAGSEGGPDPGTLERSLVQGRNDTGDVTVALLPRRSGVLTAATLASIFTAVLLVGFATRLSELDGQTSAAVLLLVPAIVGAYLSRAGEHPFATRMLTGVRVLALTGGMFAVVLSAMIGAGLMKLERVPVAQGASAVSTPPATGPVRDVRCSITSRSRGPRDRRTVVPEDLNCSLVRERQNPAPVGDLRVNPTVLAVSWTLAILSSLVAIVLALGYAWGTYVRKAAAS